MTIGWDRVAGPFRTLTEAEAEQKRLGEKDHSVVGRMVTDSVAEYHVEKMVVRKFEARPTEDLIFGKTWEQIQAMQMKRGR